MKVGVIKLGARISFDSLGTSGGTGETISIIKMLAMGGAEVVALTKIIKNESQNPIDNVFVLPILDWYNDINDLELDALLVLNGNVNFFGGAEDAHQIANYHIINNFKGPVFYNYCDPSLTLKQLWPAIEKKEWGNKYKQSDIEIVRNDIIYLSQPYDTVSVLTDVLTGKNEIRPAKVVHYPFEQFPCLHPQTPYNENPGVDLSYGGTMRGGKREKKMIKYYFDYPTDISVEMFGKITKEDFKPKNIADITNFPTFTGAVNYGDMHRKMNDALAHVVIGDVLYEQIEDIAQRAYESIWSKNVVFIDSDLDSVKRVYKGDDVLTDFLYVESKEEVIDKIRMLKADPTLRKTIVESQINAINFNANEYCENFVKLIKAHS